MANKLSQLAGINKAASMPAQTVIPMDALTPLQDGFKAAMEGAKVDLAKLFTFLETSKRLPNATSLSDWHQIPDALITNLQLSPKTISIIIKSCQRG